MLQIFNAINAAFCFSWHFNRLYEHAINHNKMLKQGFTKSTFKGPNLNFHQCQRSGLEQLVITIRVSRIQAMNFAPLTSRGHSPITWTVTPHSQSQITQGLHFPSSTAPTQLSALITHTPENHLTITITQSHTHAHTT